MIAVLSALGACLGGCASFAAPSSRAPPDINFSGIWKLDTRLSTSTHAALLAILPKHPLRRREVRAHAAPAGYKRLKVRVRSGGNPIVQVPVDISLQLSVLSGGQYLKISQRPNEFVVANGNMTNDYVPGEVSVVSIPHGVAERRTGWRGKDYWVELDPQFGPNVTERFHLADGGKRMVETIDVASSGAVKKLSVTRVYEPAGAMPTLVPNDD